MLLNLTPHMLKIQAADGSWIELPPSGQVARVAVTRKIGELVDHVQVYETQLGEVEGLPEPEPSVRLIVSRIVLDASKRYDLLAPGELVRDAKGQPIGCLGLSR